MNILEVVMPVLFVLSLYTTAWWLWSWRLKDNSWADVAWGLGFVVAGVTALVSSGNLTNNKLLLLLMVALWGCRLSGYILWRKHGKPEDKRYAAWREEWGATVVWRSLLQVFWLQGALLLIIAAPVWWTLAQPQPTNQLSWGWLGVGVWLVGWAFEVVGDWQLWQFKRHPQNKGRVMNQGLWKYTRHPNYFGESTLWWGVWIMVLNLGAPWWTIIGPATITFLLLKVSGVTLLESHFHGNPEYQAYQKNTSPFISWWPKKGSV